MDFWGAALELDGGVDGLVSSTSSRWTFEVARRIKNCGVGLGHRNGYRGVFGMDTQEDILWVKNESKVLLCYMSANGWWDRSLNYHMQQIVGNKLWHHCKNWNKNKISLFWLPSLFELCDLSLNCTPGTSGDNFIILHKFRPKHSLWRSKKSFRRLEALERGRPCQRSLVWGSGAWNAG